MLLQDYQLKHVYKRTAGVWSQEAYLKSSNSEDGDNFGDSVSVSNNTLVVGAGTEDSSATGVNGDQQENTTLASGAAYIFIRDSSGNWSQQAYLKASNTESSDGFGFSVSIFGDTIAVGAAGDDSASTGINSDEILGGSLSGAVYVFERDNAGIWTQQYYVKASNTGRNDEFNIVSLSADTLVVGAPFEDSGATGVNGDQANDSVATRDSGAVYVFKIR